MQKGEADSYYPLLIASKTAVDVSTLATVQLDWVAGVNLVTHIPIFAAIKYNAGALGIAVVQIDAAGIVLHDPVSLLLLDSTYNKAAINLMAYFGEIWADVSKFMAIDIQTASLDPTATVDVYVYGIELN